MFVTLKVRDLLDALFATEQIRFGNVLTPQFELFVLTARPCPCVEGTLSGRSKNHLKQQNEKKLCLQQRNLICTANPTFSDYDEVIQ
jgi:hypothetical protein